DGGLRIVFGDPSPTVLVQDSEVSERLDAASFRCLTQKWLGFGVLLFIPKLLCGLEILAGAAFEGSHAQEKVAGGFTAAFEGNLHQPASHRVSAHLVGDILDEVAEGDQAIGAGSVTGDALGEVVGEDALAQ